MDRGRPWKVVEREINRNIAATWKQGSGDADFVRYVECAGTVPQGPSGPAHPHSHTKE